MNQDFKEGKQVESSPASPLLADHAESLLGTKSDITERQTFEQAKASQGRYESLVNSIDGIVWEADPETFTFTFVSKQAERILGYPLSRWFEGPDFWPDHMHPEDRDSAVAYCLDFTKRREDHQFEYRMIAADGHVVWFSDIVTVQVRDDQSVVLRGVMVDITERKQAELAQRLAEGSLRNSEERYRKLAENFPNGAVITYDRDLRVTFMAGRDLKQTGFSAEQAMGKSIDEIAPLEVAALVKPHFRAAFEGQTEIYECPFPDGRLYFAAVAPLLDGDGLISEILVITQNITEPKRAEIALREAERKYRDIFENAGEGIFQSTPDGRYIAANPALASMYGFASPEELIRSCRDISRQIYVDPTRREEFKHQLQEQGAVRGFEAQVFSNDGNKFWISVNARVVRDSDETILYYEGTVQDITDRKRTEDQLRESEERYRELFENAKDATYVHDLKGRYISVNRAAEKLSGHSREEILGRSFTQFFPPEQIEIISEHLCRKLATEGETSYETVVITKDGRRVAVEVSSHLILEKGVAVGVQGTARDITERKLAREALERSESTLKELAGELERERERLLEAQTLAKLGSWHIDLSTGSVIWSDQTHHIFETDPAEFQPDHQGFLQFVHPDDRAAVSQAFIQSLNSASADEIEHRVLMADGRIKFVQERWQVLHDEQQRPVRAVGTCMDISERKRAEAEIGELLTREQTARYAAEVMRDAAVALTQHLSLEAVLETLLSYLGKLVPYRSANVMLREGETKFVIGALYGYEDFQDKSLARAITLDTHENALLRQICTSGKSLLIADTKKEPDWQNLPGAEHVRCWLGVPLIAYGKVIGLYSVDQIEPGVFTSEHLRMAESLAAQAASAIQNAQLFEQGQRYAAELEQRIVERERAEEQLRVSHGQLRALSARLQTTREEEGARIAREIHDELGGALTGLKWDLEGLATALLGTGESGSIEMASETIPKMSRLIESTINTVRRISSELRPSVLDDLGLAAAIEWQARQFQARTRIVCNCDCNLETDELTKEQSSAVFRILQEALTNVLRHAQATKVDIRLSKEDGDFVMLISDNGRGITEEDKSEQHSLGILGMGERAHLIGGQIDLQGVQGEGTLLTVRVPISGQERVLKMTR